MLRLLMASSIVAATCARGAFSQELRDAPITGNSLGGFVLPIEPVKSDLKATCVKAWSWKEDDTQRLCLEGDVRMQVASYEFYAPKVYLWIDRIPSADGLINQIAIWFPSVQEPTRRAGMGVEGKDLLVTASTRGNVTINAPVWDDLPAPSGPERGMAEARLQRYLAQLAASHPTLRSRPQVDRPPVAPPPKLVVGGHTEIPAAPVKPQASTVQQPVTGPPILAPQGTVTFFGRKTVVDEKTDAITIEGNVLIDWLNSNPANPQGTVQLSADRAVIFTTPGSISALRTRSGQLSASAIEGVYLEGNVVATDFNYTVRSKQVYYDFRTNQALMVDAVLRTHLRNGTPAFARAAELRQLAADQFTAEKAQVSTSEFFTPHLSVGADKVTITHRPGTEGTYIEGTDATFRLSGTPVLWFPGFSGTPERFPIRALQIGYNDYRGVEVGTRLDLFNLLGIQRPAGTDAELLGDVYSKNGVGGGARMRYSEGVQQAGLEGYGFYDFKHTEQSSAGTTYISSNSFRGIASGEYSTKLSPDLLLQAQLNYISDPAFLSTFRQDQFSQHREYETDAYMRWQSGNSAFTVLGKYDLDNAVVNSYQLASRPYSVDKYPEVVYRRYADELWDALSWSQEYGANLMELQVTKGTPASIAAPNAAFYPPGYVPPAPFIQNNLPLGNAYATAGYSQDMISRVYTRQELALPFLWENIKIVPFASATALGYFANNFDSYTLDSDNYRAVLGGGARFSTEFTRVLSGVQSRILDLNRLRWIVTPNATLWYGYDTSSLNNFPIYDQQMEGISGAAVAQVGVTQRLQTYRGGPGNWRSVDWLYLDAGAVFTDHNTTFQRNNVDALHYAQTPQPVFYRWRPEYSQWGSHAYINGSLQLSSTFMLIGSGIFLITDQRPSGGSANSIVARSSLGVAMYHSPEVSSYVEWRYVNNFDPTGAYPSDQLLSIGLTYKIGNLYTLSFGPQIDLGQGNFRSLSAQLLRVFPDFDFGLGVSYDSIVGNYSFNAKLIIGGPNQRPGWIFSQAQPEFASPFAGQLRN